MPIVQHKLELLFEIDQVATFQKEEFLPFNASTAYTDKILLPIFQREKGINKIIFWFYYHINFSDLILSMFHFKHNSIMNSTRASPELTGCMTLTANLKSTAMPAV